MPSAALYSRIRIRIHYYSSGPGSTATGSGSATAHSLCFPLFGYGRAELQMLLPPRPRLLGRLLLRERRRRRPPARARP